MRIRIRAHGDVRVTASFVLRVQEAVARADARAAAVGEALVASQCARAALVVRIWRLARRGVALRLARARITEASVAARANLQVCARACMEDPPPTHTPTRPRSPRRR